MKEEAKKPLREESDGYASGDRVEITKNPTRPDDSPGWVLDMNKFKGKILTCETYLGNGDWAVKETSWKFHIRWFKPAKKEK